MGGKANENVMKWTVRQVARLARCVIKWDYHASIDASAAILGRAF
jgi:hypothetical protein